MPHKPKYRTNIRLLLQRYTVICITLPQSHRPEVAIPNLTTRMNQALPWRMWSNKHASSFKLRHQQMCKNLTLALFLIRHDDNCIWQIVSRRLILKLVSGRQQKTSCHKNFYTRIIFRLLWKRVHRRSLTVIHQFLIIRKESLHEPTWW